MAQLYLQLQWSCRALRRLGHQITTSLRSQQQLLTVLLETQVSFQWWGGPRTWQPSQQEIKKINNLVWSVLTMAGVRVDYFFPSHSYPCHFLLLFFCYYCTHFSIIISAAFHDTAKTRFRKAELLIVVRNKLA